MPPMKATLIAAAFVAAAVALSAQAPAIRIHAAKVVDGAGKAMTNATVVVQGSKITAVEPGNSGKATYDLGQLTIVPGMIDVHAHIGWHFGPDGRLQQRDASPAQSILYSAENAYVTLLA